MAQLNNSINANATTPLSATQGGTGASNPTANGVLVANGSSAVSSLVLGAGNVLIGTTASNPVAANLTAGSGVSITPATGSITIALASPNGGGFAWTNVTGTSQAIVAGNAYAANNASLVTLTLPATSAFGDSFCVSGSGAGGWKIAQNAGQQINFGNTATTAGAGGSLQSTNQYDSATLVCIVSGASSVWAARSGFGNITVT